MAKLLITGATGLLGRYLAKESRRKYEVFGISRKALPWEPSCNHECVDLTDENRTVRYLKNVRPDVIAHCAALTDVERCETEPMYARAINSDATETLARWSAENHATFVLISTDSVFDGAAGAYHEEDRTCPVNEYTRSKLAAEKAAIACCPDALIIRTNFFGWAERSRLGLAEWMLTKLIADEPLRAFTDVRFSPLYAHDLTKIILELMRREASGVFHVATRDSCSKYEFALLLAEVFQVPTTSIKPIQLKEFSFKAQRPRDTTLAVDKVTAYLEREMPTVKQGIEAMQKEMLINVEFYVASQHHEWAPPLLRQH
ncbi:MAG TPA: SDR family oxidoreductase [Candidatus Acidoferrales bacterium]|nr:SDR family oxidoreductase [Candidatus Acidoferrales bacterium]